MQALRLDIDYSPTEPERAELEMQGALPEGSTGAIRAGLPAVLAVASLEYSLHDLLLATEYSRWRVSVETDVPAILGGAPSTTISERGYVMASYRLAPWFVPGAYYSLLFPNVDRRTGRAAYQHDIAVTTRYDLNEHWLVKLEGHFMHGTAGLDPGLNGDVPRSQLVETWGVFLAKTTAYF
jgi:hypothetical protein